MRTCSCACAGIHTCIHTCARMSSPAGRQMCRCPSLFFFSLSASRSCLLIVRCRRNAARAHVNFWLRFYVQSKRSKDAAMCTCEHGSSEAERFCRLPCPVGRYVGRAGRRMVYNAWFPRHYAQSSQRAHQSFAAVRWEMEYGELYVKTSPTQGQDRPNSAAAP